MKNYPYYVLALARAKNFDLSLKDKVININVNGEPASPTERIYRTDTYGTRVIGIQGLDIWGCPVWRIQSFNLSS
jgi:hypothetical protein